MNVRDDVGSCQLGLIASSIDGVVYSPFNKPSPVWNALPDLPDRLVQRQLCSGTSDTHALPGHENCVETSQERVAASQS